MASSKIGWGGLTPSLIICNPIWYWWQNGRYVSRQWSNTRNQNTRISMASAGLCSNWMFVLVCIGLSYYSSPLLLANQQLYTLNERIRVMIPRESLILKLQIRVNKTYSYAHIWRKPIFPVGKNSLRLECNA
jgi:hypothetical protein